MKIRIALALVALFAVQGCATMSQEECLTGDWYAIGFEDGAQGRNADRIGKYRKACADYDVTPDLVAYQEGREKGLREFCRPQTGFAVGRRGHSYSGICPADLEPAFVAAYQEGKHLYSLRAQVNNTTRMLALRKEELHELEEDMVRIAAAVIDSETTNEERAILLIDAKDMAHRRGELEHEILHLERDQAVFQDRLANYEHALMYDY
ncbi:MAG: DUF2799 domain-containing protein [Proteobacteria bacterium]|nr:DUF2799 domain-containing protein [Pseudomonadota bacterium]